MSNHPEHLPKRAPSVPQSKERIDVEQKRIGLRDRFFGLFGKANAPKERPALHVHVPDIEETHHLMIPVELMQRAETISHAPGSIETLIRNDESLTRQKTRLSLENAIQEARAVLTELDTLRAQGTDTEPYATSVRETLAWCEQNARDVSIEKQQQVLSQRTRILETRVQELVPGDRLMLKTLDEIEDIAKSGKILWDESQKKVGAVKAEIREGELEHVAKDRAFVQRMHIYSAAHAARETIGKQLQKMLQKLKEKHFDTEHNKVHKAYQSLLRRMDNTKKVCNAFYQQETY